MDRFSFSAALGATLVRVGNFFNSEVLGRPTNADWGIRFPLCAYGVRWSLRRQLPAGWPPDKDYAVDEDDNSMPVAHGQASAQRRARRRAD